MPQQRGSADPAAGDGPGTAGSAAAAAGAPAGDPPPPADPEEVAGNGKSGPPVSVIVGAVLISAALLVLIALSVPFLLQRLQSDPEPPYALGDCVVQDGPEAQPVDCSEPGAFEVVLEVDTIEECPDHPRQNAIRVDALDLVYCLDPVEQPSDPGEDEE